MSSPIGTGAALPPKDSSRWLRWIGIVAKIAGPVVVGLLVIIVVGSALLIPSFTKSRAKVKNVNVEYKYINAEYETRLKSQKEELSASAIDLTGCNQRRQIPLSWNAWTTLVTDPPTGTPVETLEPDRSYRLDLDLSALNYRVAFPAGVDSLNADRRLTAQLSATGSVRFDVVIFPDDDYFIPDEDGQWDSSSQMPMSKLCGYTGQHASEPYSLPDVDAPYRFLHVKFHLRTRANIPLHTAASIGVSIWANGQPVDDLEIWRCINGDCQRPDPVGQPAVPALVTGARNQTAPDVALHIFAIGYRRVWSILRFRGEGIRDAAKWPLSNARDLETSLLTTLRTFNGSNADAVADTGTGLLNVLFPAQQAEARKARTRLTNYLWNRVSNAGSNSPSPVLVARIVPRLPLPLGLAAVRNEQDGRVEFLGRHFRIEQPLDGALPSTTPTGQCQLKWVTLRPPPADAFVEDGTLLGARDQLDHYNDRLLRLWRKPRPDLGFFDVHSFATWMNHYPASAEDRYDRSGIVILSHHRPDEIYFLPSAEDHIPPGVLARSFTPPSIAILNACGSGNPAAMGFVDALVSDGVTSVIATGSEVTADLAADFLHCFAASVETHSTATTIGQLYAESLQCLRTDHGDRAYAYMLLGDPDVPVCPISEEEVHQ